MKNESNSFNLIPTYFSSKSYYLKQDNLEARYNMTAKVNKILGSVDSFRNYISVISRRKSFRYGLPFLIFVLGGSFGLREWTQIRYQFSQVKGVSKAEAEKMGLHKDKDVTLEDTYEEIKKLDIDNWENKRGPRPWENNTNQAKEK